jgi:hypothetical protein
MDGTAAIGAALDLLQAAVVASQRRAAAEPLQDISSASAAQAQQHPALPLHLPVAPQQQLPVAPQQEPVAPQQQLPVMPKQQLPVTLMQQQQEVTSSSAGQQQQQHQHLRAQLLRWVTKGFYRH